MQNHWMQNVESWICSETLLLVARPAWLRMTLDFSRIAKEIAMVRGFFVEGGSRCFILVSVKNKKDQKNLRSNFN